MVAQHYKTMEEMMGSKEWAMTDKAGRSAMIEAHGFNNKQKEYSESNRAPGVGKTKKVAPQKRGMAFGKTGKMMQKPMGLDMLTEALEQNKKGKK